MPKWREKGNAALQRKDGDGTGSCFEGGNLHGKCRVPPSHTIAWSMGPEASQSLYSIGEAGLPLHTEGRSGDPPPRLAAVPAPPRTGKAPPASAGTRETAGCAARHVAGAEGSPLVGNLLPLCALP